MEIFKVTFALPGGRTLGHLIQAFGRGHAYAQARREAEALGDGTRILSVEG